MRIGFWRHVVNNSKEKQNVMPDSIVEGRNARLRNLLLVDACEVAAPAYVLHYT